MSLLCGVIIIYFSYNCSVALIYIGFILYNLIRLFKGSFVKLSFLDILIIIKRLILRSLVLIILAMPLSIPLVIDAVSKSNDEWFNI